MNKVKDSNQNIAKAVLKIRQDNKLSQEQFAEMVGVTRQAVSRWEMGVSVPNINTLILISEKFDIPVDEMQALPLISNYFKKKDMEDICVVSPDHGGATRARKLAVALDAPVAIIDKRRPKPNVAEIMGVLGDVSGKNCIMVDDMIDTGGTIVAGIEMLKEKGAKSVHVACTHPVFSGPAVERLQNSSADEVVVTDTIKLPEDKMFPKLKTVSVAGLLAKTIENIENCLPVSDVFEMFDFDK